MTRTTKAQLAKENACLREELSKLRVEHEQLSTAYDFLAAEADELRDELRVRTAARAEPQKEGAPLTFAAAKKLAQKLIDRRPRIRRVDGGFAVVTQ